MKKRKKIILGSITGALALALAGGGFWAYKTFVPQETPIDKNATVASNFYQAVNKDWLLKTKIPFIINSIMKVLNGSGVR